MRGRTHGPRLTRTNERYAGRPTWTLAFAPLLIPVLPYAIRNIDLQYSLAAALALNMGLAYADETRLRKAGTSVNSVWVLLVPGYLIRPDHQGWVHTRDSGGV